MGRRNRNRPRFPNQPPLSFAKKPQPQARPGRELRVEALARSEQGADEPLPLGLAPASTALVDDISEGLDLGDFNEKFRGMLVVFNRTLNLATTDIMDEMQDDSISAMKRTLALKDFLKEVCVVW